MSNTCDTSFPIFFNQFLQYSNYTAPDTIKYFRSHSIFDTGIGRNRRNATLTPLLSKMLFLLFPTSIITNKGKKFKWIPMGFEFFLPLLLIHQMNRNIHMEEKTDEDHKKIQIPMYIVPMGIETIKYIWNYFLCLQVKILKKSSQGITTERSVALQGTALFLALNHLWLNPMLFTITQGNYCLLPLAEGLPHRMFLFYHVLCTSATLHHCSKTKNFKGLLQSDKNSRAHSLTFTFFPPTTE